MRALSFGFSQKITEPTHILENSRSFIESLFTSQPNMVMDSRVHASLHSHCHHQIIFAKFDLKVFYSRPYERNVWHFSQAISDDINKESIWLVFLGIYPHHRLSCYELVSAFNDTTTNILSNLVTKEVIICDNRNAPWNRHIKSLIVINIISRKLLCVEKTVCSIIATRKNYIILLLID